MEQTKIKKAIRILDVLIDTGTPYTESWYRQIERRNSLARYLVTRWPQ